VNTGAVATRAPATVVVIGHLHGQAETGGRASRGPANDEEPQGKTAAAITSGHGLRRQERTRRAWQPLPADFALLKALPAAPQAAYRSSNSGRPRLPGTGADERAAGVRGDEGPALPRAAS